MEKIATGEFEVELSPHEDGIDSSLARLTLEKEFHGDLEANSKGQMLSVATAVNGSAGYVALELVSGSLHGRDGSFALQHSGTMNRGVPELSVRVVPDSGTDQLEGLSGLMKIRIADGKHSYEFTYTVADKV